METGWTFKPAKLESGWWIARARHTDGRTFACSVPEKYGAADAEAGALGMSPGNDALGQPTKEPFTKGPRGIDEIRAASWEYAQGLKK